MDLRVGLFFAISAALGAVLANEFEGQPECAIPCLEKEILKVGCSLPDTACQCAENRKSALFARAAECLQTNCSARELGRVVMAADAACAPYTTTSTSTSASASASVSASASASASTSTTSTAGRGDVPALLPATISYPSIQPSSLLDPSATLSLSLFPSVSFSIPPVSGAEPTTVTESGTTYVSTPGAGPTGDDGSDSGEDGDGDGDGGGNGDEVGDIVFEGGDENAIVGGADDDNGAGRGIAASSAVAAAAVATFGGVVVGVLA